MPLPLFKSISSSAPHTGSLPLEPIRRPKIGTRAYFMDQRRFLSIEVARNFIVLFIDIITAICYKLFMRDENFFLRPVHEWQRRYEALRASFVERLPARIVAERFRGLLVPPSQVFRFGGDEFLLLVRDALSTQQIMRVAQSALDALDPPIVVEVRAAQVARRPNERSPRRNASGEREARRAAKSPTRRTAAP